MTNPKFADVGLQYDTAVLDPMAYVRSGHPPIEQQLVQAMGKVDGGDDRWIGRLTMLGVAHAERAMLLPDTEAAVLEPHLPGLRRLLTEHIGSTVMGNVREGDPTVVDLRCLLHEKLGLLKFSLVDRGALRAGGGQDSDFNRSVAAALVSHAKRVGGSGIYDDDAPGIVAADIWRKSRKLPKSSAVEPWRAQRLLSDTKPLRESRVPPFVRESILAAKLMLKD